MTISSSWKSQSGLKLRCCSKTEKISKENLRHFDFSIFSPTPRRRKLRVEIWKERERNEKQGSIFRGGRAESRGEENEELIFFSFAHAAENFLFLKFLWLKFEGIKQPWHGEVKWDGRDGTWWILWLRNYWFVWNTLRMFRGILNFFLAGTHICK